MFLPSNQWLYYTTSQNFSHPAVNKFLRSISLTSHFAPTPRGLFDIPTLYNISISCHSTDDPHLYRAIFLVAFCGFLRMSNIAPHSSKNFCMQHHFLRQDIIFGPPGAHLVLKWTKTIQDSKSHHIIQLPTINNSISVRLRLFQPYSDPETFPLRTLCLLLLDRPIKPSLIHMSEMPSDALFFKETLPQFLMVSTLLEGQGPPLYLTIVSLFKI